MKISQLSNPHQNIWLVFAILLFSYLVFRNAGLHAVVMADEWYYSSFSRLSPLSEAGLPSYLYLFVSKATLSCGSGFLECARILNVIIFVAAAPLIYYVSARFLDSVVASLVTLFALAGPVNSYTAYFMPEAMYFTAFWALTLAAFRFYELRTAVRAICVGLIIGCMSLIKLHAFFLLPAIILFMLIAPQFDEKSETKMSAKQLALLVLITIGSTLAVRFVGGYIAAGNSGLSFSGRLYNAQANNSASHIPVFQLISMALFNLRGHALALALLFSMPMAALFGSVAILGSATAARPAQKALVIYAILVLGSLLTITVLFTASVAGSGQESNFRLHMRYYNFCLPLLLLAGASSLRKHVPETGKPLRIVLAMAFAATIAYAILTLWQPYTPSFVDSPELQGMTAWRQGFYLLSALSLGSVVAWAYRPHWGARVYFAGFIPVFLLIGGYAINREVARGGQSNQYDQAGAFVHNYLNAQERSHLAIVTDDGSGMFKAQFYVDDARAFQHMAPQGSVLDRNILPPTTEWVLFIGTYPTPVGAAMRVQSRGFSLVELSPQSADHFSVDFSKPDGGMLVQSAGLSGIEPWGRWSDGPTVKLNFAQPLPKKFKLGLLVEAYGPNAGQAATVTVGAIQQRVVVEKAKKMIEIPFITTGTANSIEVTIPAPTSPHDVNGSEDQRQLGLGFSKLTVDELP